MFLMSWVMALITFVIVITLYLYVSYRKPGMISTYILSLPTVPPQFYANITIKTAPDITVNTFAKTNSVCHSSVFFAAFG